MNENDDVKSLEKGPETQRFGILRNQIAEKYGLPRACVHIILDGKKMFDSDKMRPNAKVKIEFVKPPGDESDVYQKGSAQPQLWDADSAEVAAALETSLSAQEPVGASSKQTVQPRSTSGRDELDDNKDTPSISDFLIPPMWKDINPSLSEDADDVSADSVGVGRLPGDIQETSRMHTSQALSENGNSEEFFVISKDNGTVQSETETELSLRKRVEELGEICETLRKHNFILQLYDSRIRSRSDELRGIVKRNFERVMHNPDTLKNILRSDRLNEDDPEKSLQFMRPIRSEPGEVASGFRDTLDSLARMIKRCAGEDKKNLRSMEEELDSLDRKNKNLKADVKYWKDKSKDTKDRLRGVEKQRDDIKENLKGTVGALEDDVKVANYKNEQLEKRLEVQDATIDKMEKENKRQKNKLKSLTSTISALEKERKKNKESIKKNQESIIKTSTRLRDLEGEKKMLEQEVADLLTEKSKLTRTAQLQWDENELLKHQFQELQERMYEASSAQLNPETSKNLPLPSPVYCLILLFFAWDDIIAALTSFWGVLLLLPLGVGLYWLNSKDFLHWEIVQDYLDSFNKLITKVCIRLCKRLKVRQ